MSLRRLRPWVTLPCLYGSVAAFFWPQLQQMGQVFWLWPTSDSSVADAWLWSVALVGIWLLTAGVSHFTTMWANVHVLGLALFSLFVVGVGALLHDSNGYWTEDLRVWSGFILGTVWAWMLGGAPKPLLNLCVIVGGLVGLNLYPVWQLFQATGPIAGQIRERFQSDWVTSFPVLVAASSLLFLASVLRKRGQGVVVGAVGLLSAFYYVIIGAHAFPFAWVAVPLVVLGTATAATFSPQKGRTVVASIAFSLTLAVLVLGSIRYVASLPQVTGGALADATKAVDPAASPTPTPEPAARVDPFAADLSLAAIDRQVEVELATPEAAQAVPIPPPAISLSANEELRAWLSATDATEVLFGVGMGGGYRKGGESSEFVYALSGGLHTLWLKGGAVTFLYIAGMLFVGWPLRWFRALRTPVVIRNSWDLASLLAIPVLVSLGGLFLCGGTYNPGTLIGMGLCFGTAVRAKMFSRAAVLGHLPSQVTKR